MVIREDVFMNLEVVEEMYSCFFNLELFLIESGGDNFLVIFNLELVDFMIFVIDVVEGDKIFRKGGLGIMRLDLFVINKIDLVFYVGVDLKVMERDFKKMCGEKFFIFMNICVKEGLDDVIVWIKRNVLLED